MPSERRLAAIMFTDIVGYTRSMGRNESAAMRMLHINRDVHLSVIRQFRGKYLKEMGDGTLAIFPTASDAAYCASELLNQLDAHDIKLRIGIHLGEVVFEYDDVFGDGVNIASRLESLASPGTVCVSDTLYRTIRSKSGITCTLIDEVQLRNVQEPMKIYRLEVQKAPEKTREVKTAAFTNPKKSVAVLPFANMSRDPDQEYFSDGLAEELINALSRLTELHVCARPSSFQFRGRDIDVREIGRQLNVGTVVTGSVRKAGNKLRITAQLIDADNGYHLWSDRYDLELDDVFAIQDEISLAIVNHLKIELLGNEREKLLSRHTNDQEVYQAYLRANYHLNKRTTEDFRTALEFYREVVAKEPEFALAYTGMAFAHALLARYSGMRPDEAFLNVQSLAQRALDIDPDLHEGHMCNALFEGRYAWNWERAEESFRRALQLNPNHANTRHQFSWFLASTGRITEAFTEIKIAQSLDPLSLIISTNFGTLHYFNKAFAKAETRLLKVLQTAPDFVVAHQWLGRCYEMMNRHSIAVRHHKEALSLLGDDPESIASLGHALARSGKPEQARKLLERLEALQEEVFVSRYWIALIHKGMENTPGCFENLRIAVQERFDWLTFLDVDPIWEPMAEITEFRTIVQTIRDSRI